MAATFTIDTILCIAIPLGVVALLCILILLVLGLRFTCITERMRRTQHAERMARSGDYRRFSAASSMASQRKRNLPKPKFADLICCLPQEFHTISVVRESRPREKDTKRTNLSPQPRASRQAGASVPNFSNHSNDRLDQGSHLSAHSQNSSEANSSRRYDIGVTDQAHSPISKDLAINKGRGNSSSAFTPFESRHRSYSLSKYNGTPWNMPLLNSVSSNRFESNQASYNDGSDTRSRILSPMSQGAFNQGLTTPASRASLSEYETAKDTSPTPPVPSFRSPSRNESSMRMPDFPTPAEYDISALTREISLKLDGKVPPLDIKNSDESSELYKQEFPNNTATTSDLEIPLPAKSSLRSKARSTPTSERASEKISMNANSKPAAVERVGENPFLRGLRKQSSSSTDAGNEQSIQLNLTRGKQPEDHISSSSQEPFQYDRDTNMNFSKSFIPGLNMSGTSPQSEVSSVSKFNGPIPDFGQSPTRQFAPSERVGKNLGLVWRPESPLNGAPTLGMREPGSSSSSFRHRRASSIDTAVISDGSKTLQRQSLTAIQPEDHIKECNQRFRRTEVMRGHSACQSMTGSVITRKTEDKIFSTYEDISEQCESGVSMRSYRSTPEDKISPSSGDRIKQSVDASIAGNNTAKTSVAGNTTARNTTTENFAEDDLVFPSRAGMKESKKLEPSSVQRESSRRNEASSRRQSMYDFADPTTVQRPHPLQASSSIRKIGTSTVPIRPQSIRLQRIGREYSPAARTHVFDDTGLSDAASTVKPQTVAGLEEGASAPRTPELIASKYTNTAKAAKRWPGSDKLEKLDKPLPSAPFSLKEGVVANSNGRKYVAEYAYCAKSSDEIDLEPGDVVKVFEVFDDGWCLARIIKSERTSGKRNISGVCPRSCSSKKEWSKATQSKQTAQTSQTQTQTAYTAQFTQPTQFNLK